MESLTLDRSCSARCKPYPTEIQMIESQSGCLKSVACQLTLLNLSPRFPEMSEA